MHPFKLGRKPARVDEHTLKIGNYMSTVPLPPASVDFESKVSDWGMLLNQNIGDCTCAAAGHCIMGWTANAGAPVAPTDDEILQAYEKVGGYIPGEEGTDNGAIVLDVLGYWQKTGIAGHTIGAYASVNHRNISEVKQAIALLGSIYIGVSLPIYAQNADTSSGVPTWGAPPAGLPVDQAVPGSWGGHAICAMAYTPDYLEVITWGQVYRMTWSFFASYTEECYAILSPDWIASDGLSPSGFDVAQLQADLKQID